MDDQAIRAAALLAAAISRSGQGFSPANLTSLADQLVSWIAGPISMTLTVGGTVPLSIDSVNAQAILEFADRDGDKVPPPSGTLAVASSSAPGVLSAGPGTAGTGAGGVPVIVFALTAVAAGTAILSVHATAADGSPLLGPGGTPIPDAAPVTVTVNPGAAAEEVFTVPGA